MGIPAEVAPLPRDALEDADEVFAATTAGGVMPVSRVGGRILGNDRPGPVSLAEGSLLAQARGRLAPYAGPAARIRLRHSASRQLAGELPRSWKRQMPQRVAA